MIKQLQERTNEILKIVNSKKENYIYGAGKVGAALLQIFQYFNISISGFIVSDGYKNSELYYGIRVIELSSAAVDKDNANVFIATHDTKELFNIVKEYFTYVYVINDTIDLCSLYLIRTLETFREKGITFEDNYIDLNTCVMLNPFNQSYSYCWAWINEYGDLLLPSLFDDYTAIDEGPYEIEEVKLEQGDIVLDCGANIGLFSAVAANKGCDVYAFEPVPKVRELLLENCTNYLNHVKAYPYAVSNKNGKVIFNIQEDNLTSGSMGTLAQNDKDKSIEVKVIKIDDFIAENGIDKVDFIKADIEGAEREMLLGAAETIKKFLPKIAVCTYHLEDDPAVLEKIIKDLSDQYTIIHKWKKLFAFVKDRSDYEN